MWLSQSHMPAGGGWGIQESNIKLLQLYHQYKHKHTGIKHQAVPTNTNTNTEELNIKLLPPNTNTWESNIKLLPPIQIQTHRKHKDRWGKFQEEGPVEAGRAGHPGFKLIPTIQYKHKDKRLRGAVIRNS